MNVYNDIMEYESAHEVIICGSLERLYNAIFNVDPEYDDNIVGMEIVDVDGVPLGEVHWYEDGYWFGMTYGVPPHVLDKMLRDSGNPLGIEIIDYVFDSTRLM